MSKDIDQSCDEVLIANLPAGVKSAICDLLDAGASLEVIRAKAQQMTGGIRGQHGIVYLACEAFISHEVERRSKAVTA